MKETSAPDTQYFTREYEKLQALAEEKRVERDNALAFLRAVESEDEDFVQSTFDQVLERIARAQRLLEDGKNQRTDRAIPVHTSGRMTDAERINLLYNYEMVLIYEDLMRIYRSGLLLIARKVEFEETRELETDFANFQARAARVRKMAERVMEKEGLTPGL